MPFIQMRPHRVGEDVVDVRVVAHDLSSARRVSVTGPSRIRLQTNELDAAQFLGLGARAATQLPAATAARMPASRAARKNQQTIFLSAERDA